MRISAFALVRNHKQQGSQCCQDALDANCAIPANNNLFDGFVALGVHYDWPTHFSMRNNNHYFRLPIRRGLMLVNDFFLSNA